VSLLVGTGKASEADSLLDAFARGRDDHQFFSRTFLNRTLHDGQCEYVENANATINCLATSNRWGKTVVLGNVHSHGCVYKTGGEPRYLDSVGNLDFEAFSKLKYHTIHTADLSETALLVWDEMHKIYNESAKFRALITDAPRSKPPHLDFLTGSRWKFRTLGDDASGIDGNSFYKVSIDEAGWVAKLQEKLDNVVRIRIADVRGEIHLVGTMKPGISQDFYKLCVRAAARTGVAVTMDHRSEDEDALDPNRRADLDGAILKYVHEWIDTQKEKGRSFDAEVRENLAKLGITPDEFTHAIGGR
jgi:hypothetical protein